MSNPAPSTSHDSSYTHVSKTDSLPTIVQIQGAPYTFVQATENPHELWGMQTGANTHRADDVLQYSSEAATDNGKGRGRGKRGGKEEMKWTTAEIKKLITLWEQRPALYDSNNPHYRDSDYRIQLHHEISRELGIPVDYIDRKMNSLRTYYGTLYYGMEKNASENSTECAKAPSWPFFAPLAFLKKHMQGSTGGTKRKISNPTSPSTVPCMAFQAFGDGYNRQFTAQQVVTGSDDVYRRPNVPVSTDMERAQANMKKEDVIDLTETCEERIQEKSNFPTQSYPIQAIPVQSFPTQSFQTHSFPTQTIPAHSVRPNSYPTQSFPTSLPVQLSESRQVISQRAPNHNQTSSTVTSQRGTNDQAIPKRVVIDPTDVRSAPSPVVETSNAPPKESDVSSTTSKTADKIFVDLVANAISKIPECEVKEEMKIKIQQVILEAKRNIQP